MNNHELHEQAQELADTKTPYQLARELILLREGVKDIACEAHQAGYESYEYIERTGVPVDDAFDQWVEYRGGL